jgi:ABC-type dipeptide/oligopeptide/nickel transport system permease subunit
VVVALALLGGLLVTGTLGSFVVGGTPRDGASPMVLWLHGARTVPLVAAAVVLITAATGLVVGAASALGPSLADGVVSRATEIAMALPSVVVVVVLRALGVDDLLSLAATVAAVRGLSLAKTTRSDVNALLGEDFVMAARAAGASRLRLLRRHLLPHLLERALGEASLTAATLVTLDASVAFLGLGAPTTGWGALLRAAAEGRAPGLVLPPLLGLAAATGSLLAVAAHLGRRRRTGRRFA